MAEGGHGRGEEMDPGAVSEKGFVPIWATLHPFGGDVKSLT